MKCSLLLLTILLIPFAVKAQKISGIVIDEDNNPLIGVNIIQKGSRVGTITDIDGKFKLEVSDKNATLIATYIGMKKEIVKLNGRTNLTITMVTDAIALDEVVAVGYEHIKRKDLTGAVGSIKADDIKDIPVTDISQALVGRIAGVSVSQASGAADAEISIRVRGGSSITQDNSPLYIIDGVPSEMGTLGLAPSDIESVDVLKDASSTSIYGARGANGVILITTKGSKAGKTTVEYEMYYGRKKITTYLDVLDAAEYVELDFEREGGADNLTSIGRYGLFTDIKYNFPESSGVDWQKQLFGQSAATQMHRVSISGSNKQTNFSLSYIRNDDKGISDSGLKRDLFRLKYSANIFNNKLKLNVNTSYSAQQTYGSGTLEDRKSTLTTLLRYRPTAGLYVDDDLFLEMDEDPAVAEDDPEDVDTRNPLAIEKSQKRTKDNKILTISGDAQITLAKDLFYKGTFSYVKRHYELNNFYYASHPKAISSNGPLGNIQHSFYDYLTYNNVVNYRKKVKNKHDLTVMLGQEYIVNTSKSVNLGANKFPEYNFGLDNMSLAAEAVIPSTNRSKSNQLSFFTRGNYQLKSRYLFSMTLRADGSSKFGKNNKWGYFPSGAVAWRLTEERFMKKLPWISNLKLRLSFGTAGSSRIPDYQSLALMEANRIQINNGISTGYSQSAMANPDLKWETNQTLNAGLDIGLLKNRLNVVLDVYRNTTKNLLMNTEVPYTTGFSNVIRNIGSNQNQGIEIAINSVNFRNKEFRWSTMFNISFEQNKIKELNGARTMEVESSGKGCTYLLEVGQPIGQMYGYVYDGIYTVKDFTYNSTGDRLRDRWVLNSGVVHNNNTTILPGTIKFKNTDGSKDNLITTADRVVIGNALPLFFGGLNNTFSFAGFDMSIFLNFSYGNDVYNANKKEYSNLSSQNRNTLVSAFEGRYRTIDYEGNKIMDNPELLNQINANATKPSVEGQGALEHSDLYVEDGSFLRINNITLGYTFPRQWVRKVNISNLRIYCSAYNLVTFTKYSGYDPEVGSRGITPGVDWGAHPRTKSIVVGASLTF